MYSGTGSATLGANLLYDGIVKSMPITINVKCSLKAFNLSEIKFKDTADLHVLPPDDTSDLKFKIEGVVNNVPGCIIIAFDLNIL